MTWLQFGFINVNKGEEIMNNFEIHEKASDLVMETRQYQLARTVVLVKSLIDGATDDSNLRCDIYDLLMEYDLK